MRRITNLLVGGLLSVLGGLFVFSMPAPVHAQNRGPIECGSSDNRFARCPVPWRDAEMVNQTSKAPCIRGRTWGMDRDGLWVDQGCRGRWVAVGGGYQRPPGNGWGGGPGPGPGRPPGYGQSEHRILCGSSDNKYSFCAVDIDNGDAQLIRQDSKSACSKGYSWGVNRGGVWTNHGCRGQFLIQRRR
jgi:hypothetical protein